ncbi:MAG TPA: CAP domain-containing protein [Solirubrobacteraceae bacterium]|nr:CAP domain-containing protein [Solirubrobacteraceae bacterium]
MRLGSAAPVLVLAAALAGSCSTDQQEPQARTQSVTVEIGRPSQAGDSRSGQPAPRREKPQVPGDARCDGARQPTTEENLREAEIAIRCLTNAAREENGLRPLEFDERLARAAATRSNDMARMNYFAHEGPDGGNVQRAVRRTGWIPSGRSWLLGENIGWAAEGGATPAQLVRSWLDSPTHRANLLADHFRQLGVGAVAAVPEKGASPGATYTQVFGVTGRAARDAQSG